MPDVHVPQATVKRRRELAASLGVADETADGPTFAELQDGVDVETAPEFTSMGAAIRTDLAGQLDADTIGRELDAFETQIQRIDEVRDAGVPAGDRTADELYRELIAPAQRVYDHLETVAFFESIEEHLPAFTPDHIDATSRELLKTEPLTTAMADCGFDESERVVLLSNVLDNEVRLSRWVPTRDIPEEVEFDVDYIPPVHQRAAGGALLWINALDRHLWHNEILVTDELLDDAAWHTKAMLGGIDVMFRAARAIADGDDADLTDAQVTAGLLAGAAMCIVNQEELMKDVFWLTDEKRAPTRAR